MKKIILLVVCLLLLTGCNADYSLEYKNGIFSENLSVTSKKDDVVDNEKFDTVIRNYYNTANLGINYKSDVGDENSTYHVKVYNKELIDYNDIIGIKYDYTFDNYSDLSNSNIIFNLFSGISITDQNINLYGIKNIFASYPYLETITITFDTDKYVTYSNADKFENNKYYWYINKDNYTNRNIVVNLNDKEIDYITNKLKNKSSDFVNIILYILLVVVLIGVIIIYNKIKKSNK